MIKKIREIIAHYCGGTYESKDIAAKQILDLFKCTCKQPLIEGAELYEDVFICLKCGKNVK